MEQNDSPSTDSRYKRVKDADGSVRPAEDNGYRFKPKATTNSTSPKLGRDGA